MNEMTEMERCTRYKREGDLCTVSCRLGLWSVSGKYDLAFISEASDIFEQYKSDGAYRSIIGNKAEANG